MDDTLKINIIYETYKNTPLTLHNNPKQIKHLQIICNEEWFMGLCKDESYIWSHKIWTDEMPPCILFTNIVNFTNLISLTLEAVALETQYWVQFAINSICLKELHLSLEDVESKDFFNFSEEAFESLFKIPTLEKVSLNRLRTNFFPKGDPTEDGNTIMKRQSNIKDLKISYWLNKDQHGDDNYELSDEFSESFAKNIGTFIHLEKLTIGNQFNTKDRDSELNNVINNCPKLESVSIYNCCKLETLVGLIKMPNMKSITMNVSSNMSCGLEKDQLPLLKDCDLSKIIHFDVIYYVSSIYTNLYEEIYEQFKDKCGPHPKGAGQSRVDRERCKESKDTQPFIFEKRGPYN